MDIQVNDEVVTSVGVGRVLSIFDKNDEKIVKVEILEPTDEANYYGAVKVGTIGFFYAKNLSIKNALT